MEILRFLYYNFLYLIPILLYFLHKKFRNNGSYTYAGWHQTLKLLYVKSSIQKHQNECKNSFESANEAEYEKPRQLPSEHITDSQIIYGLDSNGNSIAIRMTLIQSLHAEIFIEFSLANQKIYHLPGGTIVCSISSREWKAHGLQIQILEPFSRLRITYNGFLKDISSKIDDGSNIEHIQFNFIWNSASKPMHYPQDMDLNLLSGTFEKEEILNTGHFTVLASERSYEQFGALTGFLKGSGYFEEVPLRLISLRKRIYTDPKTLAKDSCIFGACKDGTLFSLGTKSWINSHVLLKHGIVLLSNGKCFPIIHSDLDLKLENIAGSSIHVNFKVENKAIRLTTSLTRDNQSSISSRLKNGWNVTMIPSNIHLDTFAGNAITTFWENQSGPNLILPKPLLQEMPIRNPENVLVCRLTDDSSLDLSLTGGKGNSLGLLSRITTREFIIPEGFIVTVSAFRKQLLQKRHLDRAVDRLEKVCYGKIEGKIEDIAEETTKLFSNEDISEDIAKLIEAEITDIKQSNIVQDWTWAVRSSGVGEDSEELSAAGQNSTYLGCKDPDILRAITACWGSLYTHQSIEYRRQHGLPIRCEMGVVVQRMVPADCAGVLFTCHPATGDPSKMIITSNYGLGESVVAGSVDPDTIILSRSYNGEIRVLDSSIGDKKMGVILDDGAGTKVKEIDVELTKKLSITEEKALRLAKIAVIIEGEFGNPRDIEWAFVGDKLYILQSRPITTLNVWTEYELLHEFDTPVLSDESLYSRVNIGEVMRGAITALTRTTVLQHMDLQAQKEHFPKDQYNPYTLSVIPTMLQHGFLDVLKMVYRKVPRKITVQIRVMELALIGYPLMDDELHRKAMTRNGVQTFLQKYAQIFDMIKKLWNASRYSKKTYDISKKWKISLRKEDTVSEMFKKIDDSLYMIGELIFLYGSVMFSSIFYQMIAINVLTGKKDDLDEDTFHDISLILCTNAGIETLETPVILENIASTIRNSNKAREFTEIDPRNGLNWMRKNCTDAADIFDKFLDNHGHRLFQEYELYADTWAEDPSPLIEMIQVNCRSETVTKKAPGLSVEETVDKLITPQTNLSKKVLRFLINKLRQSMVSREKNKSHMIRSLGKFRTAYKELAIKMVAEGYLPQAELIYYLTRTELKDVIAERNPVLITKAMRRQRLHPTWNRLQFPDMSKGYPTPERTEDFVLVRKDGEAVVVSGTPVCPGIVQGRACVIVDLKDCVQIQPGDILITYSTDVGWTPYFPMLTGLVTEIGGLISHGAVVAREYGLPCMVGVQKAMNTFKTGDQVLLNSKVGTLQLVSEETEL